MTRTRNVLKKKRVLGPGKTGDVPPYICKGGTHPPYPSTGKMEIEKMSTAELKVQLDRLALVLQERQHPSKSDRDLCSFSDAIHEKMGELLAGNIAGNAGPLAVRQIRSFLRAHRPAE